MISRDRSSIFPLRVPRLLILLVVLICVLAVATLPPNAAQAATLPEGFEVTTLVRDLGVGTQLAIAPDGRIWVAEQSGVLLVIENDEVHATALTLNTLEKSGAGIKGIAFDPEFPDNPHVFVSYVAASGVQRLSRFTIDPSDHDVLMPSSEFILLDGVPTFVGHHFAGAIHFAIDGTILMTIGDGGVPNFAQSLDTLRGKMIRLNRDGSIPPDNPFVGVPGAREEIYALGLRNPFTFAVDPVTGRIFINDVGEATWEEINEVQPGVNFGWPICEGACGEPGLTDPVHTYHHSNGCAVVGGTFYRGSGFPLDYDGDYIYADFCFGYVNRIDQEDLSSTTFMSGNGNSTVDLATHPDGSLIMLVHTGGGFSAVQRVEFVGDGNKRPTAVIEADVTSSTTTPLSVNFSAENSTDPDLDPLTFQWDFGDGSATSSGTATSHTFLQLGQYTVQLTADDGAGGTDTAELVIVVGNPPQVTINTPSSYAAGDQINYSATVTDVEDGTIPDSAHSWSIIFHHSAHSHPLLGPITDVSAGSFGVPTGGETSADVFIRIHLTVTDSDGIVTSTFADVLPQLINISLETDPPGLSLGLDGPQVGTPLTVQSVVGLERQLSAASQLVNGDLFTFDSWSNGGNQTQTFITPATSTTLIASFSGTEHVCHYPNFATSDGLSLIADSSVSGGSLILTQLGETRVGAAWCQEPQDISSGFETEFTFRITDPGAGGGDGFAFLIQNTGDAAIGGNGAGLGYGGKGSPISSSVAIEFDTVSAGLSTVPDKRIVIDSGISDVDVRADVTWNGQKIGLVARHDGLSSDENWLMGWYDGASGKLNVGKRVGGVFTNKGQANFAWGALGTQREMVLSATGTTVTLSVDGTIYITTAVPELKSLTHHGLFTRGGVFGRFDDFAVTHSGSFNFPPEIIDIPVLTLMPGDTLAYDISATDAESNPITLSLSGEPGFASIVDQGSGSGILNLNPSVSDIGNYGFSVVATTPQGASTELASIRVVAEPIPLTPLVTDPFDTGGTSPLGGRSPLTGVEGEMWSIAAPGNFEVTGGNAEENSGSDASDRRAVIETGVSNQSVSALISAPSGKIGLVARHPGSQDNSWIMAWFNSDVDLIVLAKRVSGAFSQLSSTPIVWGATSSVHLMNLVVDGDVAEVFIDGVSYGSGDVSDVALNTYAGLFARTAGGATYDDFEVRIPGGVESPPTLDPVPDQVVIQRQASTTIAISALDLNDDSITLSLLNAPSWVSIDDLGSGTGLMTLNPGLTSVGIFSFEVHATAGSSTDIEQITVRLIEALSAETEVFDEFSDSDEVALVDHLPTFAPGTSNWSAVAGAPAEGGVGFLIVSNGVVEERSNTLEPDANHIAIHTNGTGQNSETTPFAVAVSATGLDFSDGNFHTARVSYDGSTLQVFLDGSLTPAVSADLDLPVLLGLSSGAAYLGFTAATSAKYETHEITKWTTYDLGDAPASTYKTAIADDGARHVVRPGFHLGASIDTDSDDTGNASATTDDQSGIDDEDGVVFLDALSPGKVVDISVISSATGFLDAWVDFNGDGTWDSITEKIFDSQLLSEGDNALQFSVPVDAVVGLATFARFRLSSDGGLDPGGFAPDGEVEDYAVNVASSINGHISLQGVSSSTAFALISPTVTLVYNAGEASSTVIVDSDGSFSFSIDFAGTYELETSAPGFIPALYQGVGGPAIELSLLELRSGLVDDDDVVSIRDISAAAASFGLEVVDRIDAQGRIVDMNADGAVDIMDISAIASNFGSSSPISWAD